MKKLLLFCYAFMTAQSAFCQAHLRWTNTEVTPFAQINDLKHASTDAAGNTYTINFTQSNRSYYVTYRFFAYDNKGVKQWQYDNDSCFTDCADNYRLTVPAQGNGAIFIGTYDDLSGAFQIRLKHIDSKGTLAWQNNWTSPMKYATPIAAQLDAHGDLVVAFRAVIKVADQQDFAVAKFDTATGAALWHYELPDGGTPGSTVDEDLTAMTLDQSGNVYASGLAYHSATGKQENILVKISSSGALQYRKTIWSGLSPTLQKTLGDGKDFLYLFGLTSSDPDSVLVRHTLLHLEKRRFADGSLVWSRDISHDSADIVPADMMLANNRVYTGYSYKYFIPDTSFSLGHWSLPRNVISCQDTAGLELWQQDHDGSLIQLAACGDRYCSLVATDDTDKSSLLLSRVDMDGKLQWSDSLTKDYSNGMISFDASCNIYLSRSEWMGLPAIAQWVQQFSDVPTRISDPQQTQPSFSIWPNPAQDEVTLQCNIALTKEASLSLTDLSGRLIWSKPLQEARTTLSLNNLAPGTYLLTLHAGAAATQVQRVVKL